MTNVIDSAQAPSTFDVLSFIEHTAYPTEEVTVYTDVLSGEELLKANTKRLELDESPETEAKKKPGYKALDGKIAELTEKVKASALTFNLRGLPPGLVQELYGDMGEEVEDSVARDAENKLVASTITGVKNVSGGTDPRVWDAEDVNKLRHYIKEGEYGRLINAVIKVNFNATVFDQATDAGFLGGSADVAD